MTAIIANHQSAILGAVLTSQRTTQRPSDDLRLTTAPRGRAGRLTLTGHYTGTADQLVEAEVIGSTTANYATRPHLTGIGSGHLTVLTVDAAAPTEVIRITLDSIVGALHTWRVLASISGQMADWSWSAAAPSDYFSGRIGLRLEAGGIAYALGDTWTLSIERGRLRWRMGGDWREAGLAEGAIPLDAGLTLVPSIGASPSYVLGDAWSWQAIATWGLDGLRAPGDGAAYAWSGDEAIIAIDLGVDRAIDTLLLAEQDLPPGAEIRWEGSSDPLDDTPIALWMVVDRSLSMEQGTRWPTLVAAIRRAFSAWGDGLARSGRRLDLRVVGMGGEETEAAPYWMADNVSATDLAASLAWVESVGLAFGTPVSHGVQGIAEWFEARPLGAFVRRGLWMSDGQLHGNVVGARAILDTIAGLRMSTALMDVDDESLMKKLDSTEDGVIHVHDGEDGALATWLSTWVLPVWTVVRAADARTPIIAMIPPWSGRYLRLTVSGCGATGGSIGWLWAGVPWRPRQEPSAVEITRVYGLTQSGAINPVALYRGKGQGGTWRWDLNSGNPLWPEDAVGLLSLLDWSAAHSGEWVCLAPDPSRSDLIPALVQLDDDTVRMTRHVGWEWSGQEPLSCDLTWRAVIL